jgi:hypothetical protein|tara:strand:+ start:35 stop:244 length:210 start_codon:yes stop_codon:yes gene_type:complete
MAMGKMKDYIMGVQGFVWDFFDDNGKFVANNTIKTKEQLLNVVKYKFGTLGFDIAKDEIFAIETNDHFS